MIPIHAPTQNLVGGKVEGFFQCHCYCVRVPRLSAVHLTAENNPLDRESRSSDKCFRGNGKLGRKGSLLIKQLLLFPSDCH